MKKETLERLLNKACDLITSLEEYARLSEVNTPEANDLNYDLNAFFEEINSSDEIDDEMKTQGLIYEMCPNCNIPLVTNTESDDSTGLLCTNCGWFPNE